MTTLPYQPVQNFTGRLNLNSKAFSNNKYAHYDWLLQNEPVHKGKLGPITVYLVSGYDDCVSVLKDPRILRNRTTVTGGSRTPFPMPNSVKLLANSMITDDGAEHRRLRGLVHKAFTPQRLRYLEDRIETMTDELLDKAEAQGEIDLRRDFALPIPVTVIAEMVGVSADEVPEFASYMTSLTDGLTGMSIAKTMLFDMPKAVKFARQLIERKRVNPGEDILSALIEAEEDGDKLTEDELVSMLFLLIIAGFETTVHLITNSVYTLLMYPEQLDRLRANPDLLDSAIEEVNRFNGPIHGTKPGYPIEDIVIRGVTIPKGKMLMPLLGAGNRDPQVFEHPDIFDIARTPNRHLGFGQGIHYCLGAPLARMETQIALRKLLDRFPDIRLAVPPSSIEVDPLPGWHRYKTMPVKLV